MKAVPFVVPEAVRPLVAFHERARERLRTPAPPTSGRGPFPLAFVGKLFEDLALELTDEGIGLEIGAASCFEDSPLGGRVAGSFTVGAALERAVHESARYCGGQRLWLTRRGDDVWLQRLHSHALRRGRRQANDFALQMLIDLLCRGAGPLWRPTDLHFEGPAPDHAEKLAALSVRSTSFDAKADCLVFPVNVLAMPLNSAPRAAAPASALQDLDFVDSIHQTIRYLLGVGELSLPNVAEAAGSSVRSLQRRLAASGLGFGELVDEARFRASSRLLRDPTKRILDISVALGYSDAANFTRAFRRWAGVSPLMFRSTVLQLESGVGETSDEFPRSDDPGSGR